MPTKPHLECGKLRRAGRDFARSRLPELPDAPTIAEAGYPDVNTDFVWFGLAAPAKTPPAIVADLHQRFTKALTSKPLQQKLAEQGVALGASTPDEFVARIKADTARFGPLIREFGRGAMTAARIAPRYRLVNHLS